MTQEEFLSAAAEFQAVEPVEFRGRTFHVRVMSGDERDSFEADNYRARKGKGTDGAIEQWRARMLVRCICDEAGKRLFPDNRDTGKVGAIAGTLADKLYEAAVRINGMGAEAGELEKNSGSGPSAASGSN